VRVPLVCSAPQNVSVVDRPSPAHKKEYVLTEQVVSNGRTATTEGKEGERRKIQCIEQVSLWCDSVCCHTSVLCCGGASFPGCLLCLSESAKRQVHEYFLLLSRRHASRPTGLVRCQFVCLFGMHVERKSMTERGTVEQEGSRDGKRNFWRTD